MQFQNLLVLALGLMMAACQDESVSLGKLTNGRTVESDAHRSVVYIFSPVNACTGTFIRHNLMLTAAHCVKGVREVTAYFEAQSIPSKRIITNPRYSEADRSKDIALILFPDHTAPETSVICETMAPVGRSINYVGFGLNGADDDSASAIKREGDNTIDSVEKNIIYSSGVTRAGRNDGVEATIALGDSGGPLFDSRRNCILGVAAASSPSLSLHASVVRNSFDWVDTLLKASPTVQQTIGADPELLYSHARQQRGRFSEPDFSDSPF